MILSEVLKPHGLTECIEAWEAQEGISRVQDELGVVHAKIDQLEAGAFHCGKFRNGRAPCLTF